jgi:hypothetical protein
VQVSKHILHRSTEIVFDENGEKRYDSKGRMQVRSRTLRLNREKPLTPKQRAKATKAMMAARRATP